MTVAGQATVFYTYDAANRLTQITQGTSTVSFAYDLAGRRTSLTLPNGILVEYGYDAVSRVTGITYKLGTTVLGNLTYTYDAAGNRTKIGGTFARAGVPQGIASANYNAANQQLALADKTMTYDNNGNLTSLTDSNGTTNYTWNARNQLIGISGPSVSASFEYDGLARRQSKIVNGSNTEFLYDGVNPVQETDGVNVLANMLSGLGIDEIFMRTDGAGASSLLTDALGSTVALSNSGGTAQTEYTYEPFGGTTVSGISSTNSFQFTGRENDGTGLYYYRARYYHDDLQRFVSEDPLACEQRKGVNLYLYVANNPTIFRDPSGLLMDCLPCPDIPGFTLIDATVITVFRYPRPRPGGQGPLPDDGIIIPPPPHQDENWPGPGQHPDAIITKWMECTYQSKGSKSSDSEPITIHYPCTGSNI